MVTLLVIYESNPFVILRVLSNDIIRQFLFIEYHLYKAKIVKMFKSRFLLIKSSHKCKKVMCISSTLLKTGLDILEGVSKNVGTSETLVQEALENSKMTKKPLSEEVIELTDAKVRALQLAHNDFTELAKKERERGY